MADSVAQKSLVQRQTILCGKPFNLHSSKFPRASPVGCLALVASPVGCLALVGLAHFSPTHCMLQTLQFLVMSMSSHAEHFNSFYMQQICLKYGFRCMPLGVGIGNRTNDPY